MTWKTGRDVRMDSEAETKIHLWCIRYSEDLGVDGKIILERILRKQGEWEAVDRDQWRAFVNTVMTLRVT
jgi:hypothetical protein